MSSSFTLPSFFPAPPGKERPDLLVIAGEHSGDQHVAVAVRDLSERDPGLTIAAMGGPALRETNATFLCDLTESSVVGVFEVVRHFGYFRELFARTLDWVETWRPKNICFVDNPGFNLRLAEALYRRGLSRKAGGDIQLLYYISPQVWAWKKNRRFKMARHLDALAVIFPFETESYADTDLPVSFVGHPFLSEAYDPFVRYDSEGSILLLPGSRRIAVGRILPILLRGVCELFKERPGETATIITPDETIRAVVEREAAKWPELADKLELVDKADRVTGKAVLTSSGTMSLSCALAGVPGAIVYRANVLTFWLGKMLITIPYLGIANLLLNKPMYPEFLQDRATPANLVGELKECLDSAERRESTRRDAARLRELLSAPGTETIGRWLARRIREADDICNPPGRGRRRDDN